MSVSIPQFLDEEITLGEIQINQKVYKICPPDNLQEKYHIAYYQANAEQLDIYAVEGVQMQQSTDAMMKVITTLKLESKLMGPTRRMLEALLQLDPGAFIRLKSRTIFKAYQYVDTLVKEYQNSIREEIGGNVESEGEELSAPLEEKTK